MSVNPDLIQGEGPFEIAEYGQHGISTTDNREVSWRVVRQLVGAQAVVIPYDGTEPFVADPAEQHIPDDFWACGVA